MNRFPVRGRIFPAFKKRMAALLLASAAIIALAFSAAYFLPGFYAVSWGADTALVIGFEVVENAPVLIQEGEIYLPVEIFQDYLDPHFFWDEEEKIAVITTAHRLIHLDMEKIATEINLSPVELQFPLRKEGNRLYLPALFLEEFLELAINYYPETNTLTVDPAGASYLWGEVRSPSLKLRSGPGLHHPYYLRLRKGDRVLVEKAGSESGWLTVRTEQGIAGFLPSKEVVILSSVSGERPSSPPGGAPPKENPAQPLVLTWEFTYPNPDTKEIGEMPSLDIVIPTWFHLNDSRGSLRNLADPAYVHWARERGYSVWALVSNSFDPELTAEFLSSSSARKAAINQLLLFARLYRLEGFNLDFENFHHRYRELYTQFVRELAVMCREAGLVLSVNVTVPEGEPYWSLCYDRASLAREADYIVLMAYDEHWSSSPVAGSVSSLPWVEKNLSAVLKEVPAEKLILGVPFYTRLWRIDEEGGDRSISSRDYGMKRIEEILAGKDLEIGWDESNGQYLVEYREGECTFMAWLEESNSMERRLQLVNSYRLAGVAGWRRGLEKPEIWELIENVLGKASP